MEVSRSGFYEWLKGSKGMRHEENEQIQSLLRPIHELSRQTYGRRRLAAALKQTDLNFKAPSINRVERQMKCIKIAGYRPKSSKRTTISDPILVDSPNLVKDAEAKGIEEIWVSDITYIRTKQGWLYLCTIMDLYSRRIVGWSLQNNMKVELVLETFMMAHNQRTTDKLILFHSDKGGQYKSKKFRRRLKRLGYKQSMTGVDHCFDNAHAESLFSTLKRELVRGKAFENHEQARSAIFEYIEVYYNRVRLHSALAYQSPERFEESA